MIIRESIQDGFLDELGQAKAIAKSLVRGSRATKKEAQRKCLISRANDFYQFKIDSPTRPTLVIMPKNSNMLRDKLMSKARNGEITPEQAEAEAKAAGLPPFATEPEFAAFDPMAESRWPIVKAIAWIAWRDLKLVMEQGAAYRSLCRQWVFQEWCETIQNEERVVKRAGWFLEPWHGSSAAFLSFHDAELQSEGQLPASARLTPSQARGELWRALLEGQLKAEGFDKSGALVEIRAAEWAHLQLFPEPNQDVLKYEPLDRDEPYTKVLFRRDDLVRLWPRYATADIDSRDWGMITDLGLDLMTANASHVPLSIAICWVITDSGTTSVPIRDEEAWRSGVSKLMPKISDGSVEIIGRDEDQVNKVLPPVAFASIDVPFPLIQSLASIVGEEDTHIRCYFLSGRAEWKEGFDDQFFAQGSSRPSWTHLEVRREHVLKLWPRPNTKSRSLADCQRWLTGLMRQHPERRLKSKAEFRTEARKKFGPIALRQFQKTWDAAIEESGASRWSSAGRLPGESYRCAK